jgi:hypothetical protein
MNKVIKEGKVAVLISPGYGAGWYTWNESEVGEQALFSPELVTAVLAGAKPQEVKQLAESLFPTAYCSGVRDVVVEWVPVGKKFRVTEYDGNESLEIIDEMDWLIA